MCIEKEISSFSLVDYFCTRIGANKFICGSAMFLVMLGLLPSTIFLSNFAEDPYVRRIRAQIDRGELVRKSGILPSFTRVSFVDPESKSAFEHYCQLQCGLAPIVLIHDQKHEYLLLNAQQETDSLPEGYVLNRDFGHGLMLLKKGH